MLEAGRNVYNHRLRIDQDTLAQLPEMDQTESKGGLGLFCLSIPGAPAEGKGALAKNIVRQVETLRKLGYGVLGFRVQELYKMSTYANRGTQSRIDFAIGLSVLVRVLEDR